MYTTRLTPPKAYRTLVTARGRSLELGGGKPIAVTLVTQGLRGLPGDSGEVQISADAGNQLTTGTDSKLLVPGGYDFEGLVAATLSI